MQERQGLLGVFDKLSSSDEKPAKPAEPVAPPKPEAPAVFEIEDVSIRPGEIIDESTALQDIILSGKSQVIPPQQASPESDRPKRPKRKIHLLPPTLDFA